jgi:hypothetical protein
MVSNTVDQLVALHCIWVTQVHIKAWRLAVVIVVFIIPFEQILAQDMYGMPALFLGTQDIPGSIFCMKAGNLDYHDPYLFVNQNLPLFDTLILIELIYCNSLTWMESEALICSSNDFALHFTLLPFMTYALVVYLFLQW